MGKFNSIQGSNHGSKINGHMGIDKVVQTPPDQPTLDYKIALVVGSTNPRHSNMNTRHTRSCAFLKIPAIFVLQFVFLRTILPLHAFFSLFGLLCSVLRLSKSGDLCEHANSVAVSNII